MSERWSRQPFWLFTASIFTMLVACGGAPPPPARGVLEANISSWSFRRYQELLDVEIWVPRNKAVAHTASYVRGEAEKAGRIEDSDVVNAFVTRYEHDRGVVRALIMFVRRLAQESGYVVEEREQGGVQVFAVSGLDESWVLWASRRHVIKIGGRYIKSVPEALIEAYGDRYPSQLKDGMLEGPLPEGPSPDEQPRPGEPYDPANPTPDWQKYNPGKLPKSGTPKE